MSAHVCVLCLSVRVCVYVCVYGDIASEPNEISIRFAAESKVISNSIAQVQNLHIFFFSLAETTLAAQRSAPQSAKHRESTEIVAAQREKRHRERGTDRGIHGETERGGQEDTLREREKKTEREREMWGEGEERRGTKTFPREIPRERIVGRPASGMSTQTRIAARSATAAAAGWAIPV